MIFDLVYDFEVKAEVISEAVMLIVVQLLVVQLFSQVRLTNLESSLVAAVQPIDYCCWC